MKKGLFRNWHVVAFVGGAWKSRGLQLLLSTCFRYLEGEHGFVAGPASDFAVVVVVVAFDHGSGSGVVVAVVVGVIIVAVAVVVVVVAAAAAMPINSFHPSFVS